MHLLAIYAHPDDEAFGTAGTFASITDKGGSVTLVCATRGEAGEISDSSLSTHETLGEVREAELLAAMKLVNVEDIRMLNYRDSGMAGSFENNNPRSFVRADHAVVTGQLLSILEEIKPDAVITFGADGVYGHPDHIKAHEVATAAMQFFATGSNSEPYFYYNAVPRERIIAMAKRPNGPFSGMSDEQLSAFGTPSELITTVIDVSDHFDRKMAAIRAHRTQVAADGPWAELDPAEVRELMRFERFRLVGTPATSPGTDLLAQFVNE